MFGLGNQVAFVTGAARGIGFAIGKSFLQAGAAVTFADMDAAGLEAARIALGRETPAAAARASFVPLDVTDHPAAVRALAETHARAGRLDILVNNAGLGDVTEFLDLELARLRRVMEVNLFAPFVLAQAAAVWMRQAGYGRIVNVASMSGRRAGWARTAYGTSKAALIHLTKQIAMELSQYGITANAILPGPIDTELARSMHTEGTRRAYTDSVPVGRYGREEEVAAAALFLASREAAYVTGIELPVDGGHLAGGVKFSDLASKKDAARS
jgi:NAD(P)-dependent dehydrogenase (short-subunit alcohol dehydrogenase family)